MMLELELESMSNGSHSWPFLHKKLEIRIIAGVTSGLSIVGSLLIILSYICFKVLRTKAREILMHISFMDFGCASCNLIGAGINFERYYKHCQAEQCTNVSTLVHIGCKTQGTLATYFTLGSIMWTISLSVYLYILISQRSPEKAKLFVWFAYVFCYLMPAGIALWLVLTQKIGYSPYEATGWCSTLFKNPWTRRTHIYVALFGYNLWIILTFVLVPLLSVSVHMYIREEIKNADSYLRSTRVLSALQKLDYKFLLIPVAFIVLRMWSFIADIVFVFAGVEHIRPTGLAIALMVLEGIGDSGQGAANAILFVLFTKKVRDQFLCRCRCKTRNMSIQERTGLLDESKTARNRGHSYSIEDPYTPTRGSPT